ncbi:MAG: CDP-glycerol glycerophosphotransferase family protein [Propionicimonas sp.]|uniref:CDP-glycerol glycerophosphotransferase family protein n=1 Tax=Propionicimonas sp. TaxID=1955623 RepID=UPI003D0F8BC0
MKRGGGIQSLGRAPVPEWEEVARAAWPGRLPAGITTLAGRSHLVVVVAGLALLVLAAWLRLPWLGLAAWTLGAAGEWLATPADTAVARLLDLVGFRAQLRALLRSLVAAALVFAASPAPWAGLGYVSAVLVLQLAWTAQPVAATWLSRSAPPLRYVPGADVQPQPFTAHARAYSRAVGTPGVLVAGEFVVLGSALGASTGAVPNPVALLLAALVALGALVWLVWTLDGVRRTRGRANASAAELLATLADARPTFLVYVSLAARQSRYIVNQWLPALDALPQDGVLVVREASQLGPLSRTRHPVVYAPGQRDVERLLLPGIRAAFYLAYGERNGQLLREPRLRHVMLLHGDSDKATSANGMARAFDEVWVAGPAAVQRYRAAGVDLPEDRFVQIGRPQVAGLPVGPSGRTPPVVLYAPTFEGYYDQTSHSSLDTMGVDLVRRLLADGRTRVWFRPHPASGVSRPAMLAAIAQIETMLRTATGGHVVVADRGLTLPECLAEADLLVSDISSVATDYLFTERPVITCDPAGLPSAEFVAAYPTQAASYLLRPGLADFDTVLDAALGADPLHDARVAMKKFVLGDPAGGPQAAFAASVARITAD